MPWDEDWTPTKQTPVVDEKGEPRWSGLYDHLGRKLVRPHHPPGFRIPAKTPPK